MICSFNSAKVRFIQQSHYMAESTCKPLMNFIHIKRKFCSDVKH
ncbi:hypothetical protein SSYIS1_08360 [Serratia symbiotica]|uniref:Uncharacterized protein n=1 Tax=Serratia symbiotica TaxID=138074 RepID=A0A455VNL3_9GAMM|nr:hypothetical protein SSYIS1_08360 [Serratia symbiotica]